MVCTQVHTIQPWKVPKAMTPLETLRFTPSKPTIDEVVDAHRNARESGKPAVLPTQFGFAAVGCPDLGLIAESLARDRLAKPRVHLSGLRWREIAVVVVRMAASEGLPEH